MWLAFVVLGSDFYIMDIPNVAQIDNIWHVTTASTTSITSSAYVTTAFSYDSVYNRIFWMQNSGWSLYSSNPDGTNIVAHAQLYFNATGPIQVVGNTVYYITSTRSFISTNIDSASNPGSTTL